jgi:hypothetical protein
MSQSMIFLTRKKLWPKNQMVEGEQRKEEMLKIVIKNRRGAKIGKKDVGTFFLK